MPRRPLKERKLDAFYVCFLLIHAIATVLVGEELFDIALINTVILNSAVFRW